MVIRTNEVASLLDAMIDGREFHSIVSVTPPDGADVMVDAKRALADIERVRGRPCLAYVGNVVSEDDGTSGIDASDDLPFAEMVAQVPQEHRAVDVFLSTRGGSGSQIVRFVDCLRSRFDEVDFIIPSFCMSAGTLWALSGDRIWMTARAALGPIDPQVPAAGGRYVPAQALLLLVEQLKREGDEAMAKGENVPWTAVRIIDTLDKKELGDGLTATGYARSWASDFLVRYKFKQWALRETSQIAVTDEYRRQRADAIAKELGSHERWKMHGHAISRDVLWNAIRLKIDWPDAAFERVICRAWALYHWMFDKTGLRKVMLSNEYSYIKIGQQVTK